MSDTGSVYGRREQQDLSLVCHVFLMLDLEPKSKWREGLELWPELTPNILNLHRNSLKEAGPRNEAILTGVDKVKIQEETERSSGIAKIKFTLSTSPFPPRRILKYGSGFLFCVGDRGGCKRIGVIGRNRDGILGGEWLRPSLITSNSLFRLNLKVGLYSGIEQISSSNNKSSYYRTRLSFNSLHSLTSKI